MSGKRLLAAVAVGAVVAVVAVVGGCGGSSSHRDSSGGSAGGSRYRTYAGPGFTLSIPAGWQREGAASAAGGAAGVALGAPDHSASVDIHVYPHSSQSVDQAIAGDLASDAVSVGQGAIHDLHRQIRSVSIGGASEAKELTETYTNARGRQRYADLVVLSPSGALIDVETVASPRAPASYPAGVIDSFRLAQGGAGSAA